jgi:hypothetical protein
MKMNILIEKSACSLVAIVLVFTVVFSFSSSARAQSTSAQMEEIQVLLKMLEQLQAQLSQLQGGGSSGTQCIQLTKNLYLGMNDANTAGEVSKLQRFLTSTGHYTYPEITGYYGPATQKAVQELQNDRDIIETTGFGTVGSRTRTIVEETCKYATVDQKSVQSRSNSFNLSGTANNNIKTIFVALVSPHTSNISIDNYDWHSLYETGRYVAFTGNTVNKVNNGTWEVEFEGIPDGDYIAHVYENDTSNQKLLVKQSLNVSAPDVIDFEPDDGDTFTIGVGQQATDGGFSIWVNDVFLSNGLSGTPRVSFITQPEGFNKSSYSLGLGETTNTMMDEESPSDKIQLRVEAISTSMNTVTFEIIIPEPSGLGT